MAIVSKFSIQRIGDVIKLTPIEITDPGESIPCDAYKFTIGDDFTIPIEDLYDKKCFRHEDNCWYVNIDCPEKKNDGNIE